MSRPEYSKEEVKSKLLSLNGEILSKFDRAFYANGAGTLRYWTDRNLSYRYSSHNSRLNDIVKDAAELLEAFMEQYGHARARIEKLTRKAAGKGVIGWALDKLHKIQVEHRSWNPHKPYFVLTPIRTALNTLNFYPEPLRVQSYIKAQEKLRDVRRLVRHIEPDSVPKIRNILEEIQPTVAHLNINFSPPALPQIPKDFKDSIGSIKGVVKPTIRALDSELTRVGREMGLEGFSWALWGSIKF